MNTCTEAPNGYSAKYRTYSANVNKAKAALKERCANAGYAMSMVLNQSAETLQYSHRQSHPEET